MRDFRVFWKSKLKLTTFRLFDYFDAFLPNILERAYHPLIFSCYTYACVVSTFGKPPHHSRPYPYVWSSLPKFSPAYCVHNLCYTLILQICILQLKFYFSIHIEMGSIESEIDVGPSTNVSVFCMWSIVCILYNKSIWRREFCRHYDNSSIFVCSFIVLVIWASGYIFGLPVTLLFLYRAFLAHNF